MKRCTIPFLTRSIRKYKLYAHFSSNTSSDLRFDMSNIQFRAAVEGDYESVMDLGRNLFGGFDYLPHYYKLFFKDPTWKGGVITERDKVIGFMCGHVVNSDQAIQYRGGRIQESKRGQGLMAESMIRANTFFLEKNPHVEEFYSTLKSDSFFFNTKFYSQHDASILHRNCVAYTVASETYSRGVTFEPNFDLKNVQQTELRQILTDSSLKEILFPDSYLCLRYIIMKPMVENIDIICRYTDSRFISHSDSNESLLSLGIHFPCPAGYVYHVELYGSPHHRLIADHALQHLSHASQIADSHNTQLYFFVYGRRDDFDLSFLQQLLSRHGCLPYKLPYEFYVGLRNFRDDQNWKIML